MAEPYIGEIRMFAGNFAPIGWAFCQGQILPISGNDALFTLIGTTYGGDGQSTFALPDLRSRIPVHQGNGFILAETGGVEEVTLTVNQVPAHTHALLASRAVADSRSPVGNVPARAASDVYVAGEAGLNQHPSAISPVGGSWPHSNVQPFLCINFIISLFGTFPAPPPP